MNYTDLKANIATTANRNDLTAEIILCIQHAETNLNSSLRVRELETSVTLTDADRIDGSEYQLPADFEEIISLDDGTDFIRAENHISAQLYTTTPIVYYTFSDKIYIKGEPETGSEFTLRYYKTLPTLSDSSPTNSVLTKYWTLYLYGALSHLFAITQDLELQQANIQSFTSQVVAVNRRVAKGKPVPSTPPASDYGVSYKSTL